MLEPVEIVWVRRCHFKAKPCKACGKPKSSKVHTPKKTATCAFKRQNGCATCGLPKSHGDHFGAPPSVNLFGSGDRGPESRLKLELQAMILAELERLDALPRPMESVIVECQMTFPDAAGRDGGNLKAPLEKALGDALVEGGWLTADHFYPACRFTFGGIQSRYEKGVLGTRLLFMPSMEAPISVVTGKPVSCLDPAEEPARPVGSDPLALFG